MNTISFSSKKRLAALAFCMLALLALLNLNLSAAPAPSTLIGEEAAKAAALAHAEQKAGDVIFVKVGLDRDNGTQIYEVEFYTRDGRAYDYEINAATGKVVSADNEVDSCPLPSDPSALIGEEKAKGAALAKVPGATSGDVVQWKLDCGDNRLVYEVEILYNGVEYDGEIDAVTGELLKWDVERD